MAIARQFQTTVTTSATPIAGTQYPGWILINNGAQTIFIGDSAVASGTGFPIEPAGVYSPPEKAHNSLRGLTEDRLYAITDSSTSDVRVHLQSRPNI